MCAASPSSSCPADAAKRLRESFKYYNKQAEFGTSQLILGIIRALS